jgi:hypothetical protein
MDRLEFSPTHAVQSIKDWSGGNSALLHKPEIRSDWTARPVKWPLRLAAAYSRIIEAYESLGRRRPWAFAVLTMAMLFGLVFLVFTPGFDTNDDPVMNLIVAGKGYGLTPDEHLVFSHVLVGFALKWLYTAFPAIPWYGGYLIAINFVAQTIMLYCGIQRGYTRLRLRLYLVYFATAGLYLVNNLQFTSTAFLAGQSGLLLLMLAIGRATADRHARAWLWFTAGFFLLVVSSLIRREVFYPVMGLAMLLCGVLAVAGTRRVRDLITAGGVIAAALTAATVSWQLNHAYYESDAGWRGFYEYNKLRVKFNDEAWVSYSRETAGVFAKAGWGEIDFEMISAWYFDNDALYNGQTLASILDGYPWQRARVSLRMVAETMATVLLDRESLALLLAFPLLFYCVERRGAHRLVVALATAGCASLIVGLILFSKAPPSRVYVPILSFPLAVAAFLARGDGFLGERRQRARAALRWWHPSSWRKAMSLPFAAHAAAIVLVLMLAGVFKGTYHQYRRSRERVKASQQLYDHAAAMQQTDDKLFVCWAASFPFEALRPLDNFEWMADLHFLIIGWPQKTPLHQRMKDRFAIGDLAEAMFRRTDLYLIAHSYYLGLYEQYVREHFGVELTYETRLFTKQFSLTQAMERQPARRRERLAAGTQPTRTK